MPPPAGASLFTPSGPHASSKPTPRTSTVQIGGPAPPNETPQEKVARLRAASQRAKAAQLSGFDRVVDTGRRWSDRAHRVTVYTLIGATGLATIITAIAIGDMLIHNRRQRNSWYAEQQRNLAKAVAEARHADSTGMASEQQLELLKEDDEIRAENEAKAAKKGIFTRMKEGVFGDLSKEEKAGGKMGAVSDRAYQAERSAEKAAAQAKGVVSNAVADARGTVQNVAAQGKEKADGVVTAVRDMVTKEKSRETLEAVTQKSQDAIARATGGGPLDTYAENVVQDASSKSQSWWNWATRK